MSEPILSTPLCFEAAVQRQLVLACGLNGELTGHREIIVEVIAASKALDLYDVVVDFRELEAMLDEQLRPLQGNLPENFGVRDLLQIASNIARNLAPRVPALSKITEINFIDNLGRCVSLHP